MAQRKRTTTRRGRFVVCGPLGERAHATFDSALGAARTRCAAECVERGHMTIKSGDETVYVVTPFNEYRISETQVELVR